MRELFWHFWNLYSLWEKCGWYPAILNKFCGLRKKLGQLTTWMLSVITCCLINMRKLIPFEPKKSHRILTGGNMASLYWLGEQHQCSFWKKHNKWCHWCWEWCWLALSPYLFLSVSLPPVHSHFDTRVPHGSISPDLLHGLAPQPSPLPSAVVMIKSCV